MKRWLQMFLVRVIVTAVREGEIKRFDATGRPGETIEDREVFQQYGFTSWLEAGSEAIAIGFGNVVYLIGSDDRRTRVELLAEGDIAVGQGDEHVYIKKAGGLKVKSATEVELDSPVVKLGNGTLRKLIDERVVTEVNKFISTEYRLHMHPTAGLGAPSLPTLPGTELVLANVSTVKTTGS